MTTIITSEMLESIKSRESRNDFVSENFNNDLYNYANELITNYLNQIAAAKQWDAVTRLYKKDGTEFANFTKNFAGVTVRKRDTWCNTIEYEFTISYQTACTYWNSDYFTYNGADASEAFEKIQNKAKAAREYAGELLAKLNAARGTYEKIVNSIENIIMSEKLENVGNYYYMDILKCINLNTAYHFNYDEISKKRYRDEMTRKFNSIIERRGGFREKEFLQGGYTFKLNENSESCYTLTRYDFENHERRTIEIDLQRNGGEIVG